MKVLHLSTSDINGGAARGAYWTHKALQQAGIDSWMLVAEKFSRDPSVIGSSGITGSQKIWNGIRQTVEYWPLKSYPNKQPGLFTPAVYPSQVVKQVNVLKPDIINLHWVGLGFLKPEHLQHFKQPIVWTLRDMGSFTGGCCYADTCTRYQQQCGRCPALGSTQEHDLSRRVWKRKYKAWSKIDLTLVPISHWLANCARQSSLFQSRRIEIIHNAIDTQQFRPIDPVIARSILQLPQDKKLILFGAIGPIDDQRKGFSYLEKALKHLSQEATHQNQLEAVIFGTDASPIPINFGFKHNFLGYLHDETMLALAYSSADVMVVPSVQEAFGKTAIEAMACGTPVVAFKGTGLEDIVEHQKNGYLAQCLSPEDLATGIIWVLQNSWQNLAYQARHCVEQKFALSTQAAAYSRLYTELLANPRKSGSLI